MKRQLKLRVDPPYDGESLSSFIGRCAQFYATPPFELLKDLGRPSGTARWRYDLDLLPQPEIPLRLSEAVPGWRSPLDAQQGFRNWVLGPYCRTSYCALCFEEDLGSGRTPYFRVDWVPVLVTSCWKHRVPLFNWQDVGSSGFRRLPDAWVSKDWGKDSSPTFFEQHRRKLADLVETRSSPELAKVWTALECLDRFQRLMEKQSHEPMSVGGPKESPDEHLREYGHDMILSTMKFWRRLTSNQARPGAQDPTFAAWFDPFIEFPERVRGACLISAVRRAWDLGWRRSYFLFAAQALAPLGEEATHHWWGIMPKLGFDCASS